MIRVENKKVVFNIYKNDKLFKSIILKNRLTDLYLDYVLYRLLPSPLKSVVFPNITDNDIIAPLFSGSYLKFVTTQTILDTDTTMNYDVSTLIALDGTSTINSAIGENNKSLITEYLFNLSTIVNGSLFTGIGFGRDATQDSNYLFSFIDLSLAGITKEDGVTFGVARYDEITTNEISTSGEYLPLDGNYGTLESVITCFGENGTGYEIEYDLENLSLTRLSAGIVEVSGFENFYIEDTPLYPSDSLFPSDDTYPTNPYKIKSVKFKYDMGMGDYHYTYINLEDLDGTYSDKEFKIKLKCERGDY